MLSCKEVTRLVSESMDRQLPFRQRLGLRLHLLMCRFCARYRRQMLFMREAIRSYLSTMEEEAPLQDIALSLEARQRIGRAISARPDSAK